MHADRFRRLLDAQGPFVSLYFDDSHDTADAGAQLDARLRDIRKNLEEQSVDACVVESIAAAVRATHPPVGRSGRGLVASATTGAILLDEHLAVPPVSTLIRVSDLPYIVPVVAHGIPHTSSLLVAVDHTGADISLHDGVSLHDGTAAPETVDGSGYPIHKAHKADTAGYGGPQGRVQEAIRKNIREVAQRLTQLVDETGVDVVFVTGEAPARAELLAELPERVAVKTVQLQGGGRTAGTDRDEVDREVAQEFARRRQVVISAAAERFAAGHGAGLAVEGLGEVTAALRDGAVDTLIIGDLGAATVIADHDQLLLGTDAAAVSALGGSPDRVLPADEALPLLAVATGAALVPAEAARTLTDGVAAVLRYADTGQR
jgi:peptide chain release factor subunit 1